MESWFGIVSYFLIQVLHVFMYAILSLSAEMNESRIKVEIIEVTVLYLGFV